MMQNRKLFILLASISLLITLYIGSSDIPPRYSYIAFLPGLIICLYLMIAITLEDNAQNFATSMIAILTFIRYSIVPLLYTLSNYSTIMGAASYLHGNDAVFLMMYEAIVITVAIIFANRKIISNSKTHVYIENTDRLSTIVWLCLLFCIISSIIFPSIQDIFKTILELDTEEFSTRDYEDLALGTIARIIRTLFTVIFNITRIIFPIYIIRYIAKTKNSVRWTRVFLILFILLQFLLLTTTFAEAIVSSLVIFLVVAKLEGNAMKSMKRWAVIFVIAIIITYFSVRFQVGSSMYGNGNAIEYITLITNAYFTGLDNVAASINIPRYDTGQYLQSSILQTIPFNTTLFGPRNVNMPTLFNAVNGTSGQIPPTIGNGYFYFGYLLAPVISFAFTYLSIILCRKANLTGSIWRYTSYMFISIVLALGISMYNEIIALSWVNAWGIPMFIIAIMVEKQKKSVDFNGIIKRK